MAKLQFLKGTGALPVSRDANNVYFKLGAAGEGQIALGDNIWNESVQIKNGDNVLAYSADYGLSASVSLSYDAEGKKIKLVGKEGANLGEVDATAFLKDGMLESASFENNKLIFVFNTDAGKTQIEVPVADLVDEYTAGNGLALSGKEFSVKVAGESFLSVDGEGVKLSGVQSAINDAKAAAISEANVASAAAKAAADAAQADVDALEQNVKGIDDDLTALEGVVNGHIADAVAHITAEERSAWNAAEANAIADAAAKYQVKGDYEVAGAAADALDAAKAYADGLASNYDAAGAAAAAESAAKAYADGLASNYDKAGAAATAEANAKADATTKANAAKSEAIADAEGKVNAAKATIDAYTVNGKAISANPVLNGGEIKLDGFAAVSQTSAVVASDTINSAIAKLEKSIADVSAAAVKLGTQEGNVVLTIDEATKGLSAHLEWGEF